MSTIQASCIDQTLTFTNTPVIASGGVGEDFVAFTFCPLWDGYIKTGVFYNDRGVFYSILDDTDTCVVPVQALQIPGNLFIAVFGNKNGATRTSEVLQYQIVEGAVTTVPDPDPDVYAQICQEIAELREEWNGKVDDIATLKANVVTLQENVVTLQEDVAELQEGGGGGGASVTLGTISLLASSWAANGDDFTQTVTVEGATESSIVALQPTPAQWKAINADGVTSLQVVNTDGVFTAWATDAAPSADYTLQVTITEVI